MELRRRRGGRVVGQGSRQEGAIRRLMKALAGLLAGVLAGLAMSLGVLVARAHLQAHYVNSLGDVPWSIWLPIPLALGVGVWIGLSRRRSVRSWVAGVLGGIGGGAVLGALPGLVVAQDPAWPWAGGMMGAALGVLVVILVVLLRSGRGRERLRVGSAGGAAMLPILLFAAAACGGESATLPTEEASAPPSPDSVESVVLLLGDPGVARVGTHPILARLTRDVEAWSARLGDESGRVILLVLGDIVYPAGLHAPDAPEFPEDSARVEDQVALVGGPAARGAGAWAAFLPGNHDWGEREDWEGARRIHRLDAFLERRRARGVDVSLEPDAGTGGPVVVDVGANLRLVLLDTAWWLLEAEQAAKDQVLAGIGEALASAGERRVVMAAHHPYHSAGPHGELWTLGSTLGIRTLLARSGALLQDLSSRPYRELREGLVMLGLEHRPPDIFAGGHEHSLQALDPRRPGEPDLSLVVGSGSKLTEVGPAQGRILGVSAPGYGRILVLRDGTLRIQIEATPAEYLSCPEGDASCMERGIEAFRTIWDATM